MSLKRFYYYNPFCMTTGAIIASGFGYNGEQKGEHTWNKIIGVYIWEVETSASAMFLTGVGFDKDQLSKIQ